METQLQEIIDRIQKEGVASAEERAREVIARAEKQAQEKVREAEEKAQQIVRKGEQDADRMKAAGEAALRQAGRDLVLSVHQELEKLFSRVIRQEVVSSLSPEKTGEILAHLIKEWPKAEGDDLTVLVNQEDLAAIDAAMNAALGKAISGGVTLHPVRGVSAGFRIGSGENAEFFDMTDGTLAELLAAYLNPRLAHLLHSDGAE
jgi:V/A-type H+-transporting ATPase subunit E